MARRTSGPVLAAATLVVATLGVLAPAPAQASIARGDTVDSDPAPTWGWEPLFVDGFDGPAGVAPEQWHTMLGQGAALQNGQGQLDVGHLAQIRTNTGWTLPTGSQVRVTASLVMPDTGSNYAAFWVQHPNGIDPREIDVIESYGPLKPAGAQLGSHICYDDTPETAVNACVATGRAPELWPVTQAFPVGAAPWDTYWQYAAEFTVGGDTVAFSADDGQGHHPYEMALTPDARRVPGNATPFHLRLSNKDVLPQYAVPGGTRATMLVDWVAVDVKRP
ncbi:hypothetical protein ASG76_11170 [Nocardioides sp. Soil774]|uniref:hypothetical protein n=1 Tax=Nocardioides sp. Soil774 TaxID=1736408 RepID=UPI0006FA7B08|nr:hypothetical protein [Nocardioides sp. Soil774]KRE93971.1 hypothetical protein ASG76_11170 [Nocardioides sp. Soil774]